MGHLRQIHEAVHCFSKKLYPQQRAAPRAKVWIVIMRESVRKKVFEATLKWACSKCNLSYFTIVSVTPNERMVEGHIDKDKS